MRTNYHSDGAPPTSAHARADRLTTPTCRSVTASTVDDAVAERLLAALNPERDRARAGRRRRGHRPAPAAQPRRRARRRTRPLRGRPRRTGLPRRRAGEPAGRPHPGDPVGDQARRPRRGRAGPGGGPRHAAAAARPRPSCETLAADLPGLWHAPTTSAQGPQTAAAHPDRRHHPAPRDPTEPRSRIGIRWHTGATDEITADRPLPPGPADRTPSAAVELCRRTDSCVGRSTT